MHSNSYEKNALEYLAFKVNYSYQEIREYISADTLAKTLFMPIVHPTRTDYLEYIDAWITQGDKKVVAYQTNFRRTGDRYLSPFDRGGVRYQNLLHYVYAKRDYALAFIRKSQRVQRE